MRKDRLYFYTFLAITVIFSLVAGIAAQYFVKASALQLLSVQLESGRREAKEIAGLAGYQLESGLDKQKTINNIQRSIRNTNLESLFVSMFDWSGNEICHPDITKVGQKVGTNESIFSTIDDEITPEEFYGLLLRKEEAQENPDSEDIGLNTEIIYLYPVANSDWIVGLNANTKAILGQIKELRNRFYLILVIMGFVIILSSVVMVRLLGSLYEKRLIAQKEKLEEEVIGLAKLNKALDRYQQKVGEELSKSEKGIDNQNGDKNKKRILTYLRHELLSVATNEIAFIYTENTITYVVDNNGKRSTVNSSLDDMYSALDSNFFYRANRQFIIAISAIEKIIRYGNNNLKILVRPECEVEIIIGKNKAAEFKQWLNT